MKKIGFIDLYDPEIKEKLETNNEIKYSLYVFSETANDYKLLNKVENPSSESLKEISYFCLSLPIGLLNFRILGFPFTEKEKLRKVIPFELNNLIMRGVSNIIHDFAVIDASGDNKKVLAAYMDKKTMGEILKRFISIGVDPYFITSIELCHIIKDKKENIASELITPKIISDEDKIKTAIEELKANTINLRTGEFAYTKDVEKSGRMLKITLILLLSLAFTVNANLAFKIFTAQNELSSLKQQMRGMYSSLFPADKKITDELYQMKSHMKNLNEKSDILIGVNPLELMTNLSHQKPKGIVFDEINLDREVITMKGEAISMGDLDAVKKSLSETYHYVAVSDIKPLSENKILFTVIIKDKSL